MIRAFGAGDDSTRMQEMESRIMGLEEQLAVTLDELRQARSRETGMMSLTRDMIGVMAQVERGESFEDRIECQG